MEASALDDKRTLAKILNRTYHDERWAAFRGWQLNSTVATPVTALIHDYGSRLVIGTNAGVKYSINSGWTWNDDGLRRREILCLARVDGVFYAGTDRGLYFTQQPGNESWKRVDSPFLNNARVSSIVGNGFGMMVGTNFGIFIKVTSENWKSFPVPRVTEYEVATAGLAMSHHAFFVTTSIGVFRSQTGATKWQKISDLQASSVAYHDWRYLLVAVPGDGVYRQDEMGEWWKTLFRDDAITLAINRTDILVGTSGGEIYRSVDGGGKWKRTISGLVQPAGAISAFAAGSEGEVYVGTGKGEVYRTV